MPGLTQLNRIYLIIFCFIRYDFLNKFLDLQANFTILQNMFNMLYLIIYIIFPYYSINCGTTLNSTGSRAQKALRKDL